MRKVLLTGATGFLGRGVLNRLIADGMYDVSAIVHNTDAMLPKGITRYALSDLSHNTDWSMALGDVRAVIHCAGLNNILNDNVSVCLAKYRQVNVEGTVLLARHALTAGVKRFVYVSSIKVNGETTLPGKPFNADDTPAPEDAYSISKKEAEDALLNLAKDTTMEVVIIRPPLIYGPGVKGNFALMMQLITKGCPLPFGAVRNNRRSFVALDNVVDLIVTCIDHPKAANEVFLVSDGEDISTAELFERLSMAMGRHVRLVSVPVGLIKFVSAILKKGDLARRLCSSLQVDICKTKELLSWQPPVSMEIGLQRTVATKGRDL